MRVDVVLRALNRVSLAAVQAHVLEPSGRAQPRRIQLHVAPIDDAEFDQRDEIITMPEPVGIRLAEADLAM